MIQETLTVNGKFFTTTEGKSRNPLTSVRTNQITEINGGKKKRSGSADLHDDFKVAREQLKSGDDE
jgi:hypothetical protein